MKKMGEISKMLKGRGKLIITTNGVFDLLHLGHITYLEHAKSLGDVLIVGLNSDTSVKALKTEKRPIVPEMERAEVLSALEAVDYVCIFYERTPLKFLEAVKPHLHIKGGDYDPDTLPEKQVVEKFGGKIKIVPFVKGYSTTAIIEKILKTYSK
ncbi:MAG: D-glycero-beta-D-manno-heptose 1-phosphate adenylyltransferase [Candidatus Micrarchaeota archaeon]